VIGVVDARAIHGVATWAAYEAAWRRALARRRGVGYPLTESLSTAPLVARVDYNRWIADCPCGSGVAAWPGRPSLCFGCATRHATVVLPESEERAAIEAILGARAALQTRSWAPGESVAHLEDENRAHGLPARGGS